jgi:hypothetical protein
LQETTISADLTGVEGKLPGVGRIAARKFKMSTPIPSTSEQGKFWYRNWELGEHTTAYVNVIF